MKQITVKASECPEATRVYLDDGYKIVKCTVRGFGRILGYEGGVKSKENALYADYFYDLEMTQ